MILLVADLQELKANPKRPAIGTIVEAQLDKGRGPVATALVQTGTLRVGDTIVVGATYGKVRALENDKGKRITKAGSVDAPSVVLGLAEVPGGRRHPARRAPTRRKPGRWSRQRKAAQPRRRPATAAAERRSRTSTARSRPARPRSSGSSSRPTCRARSARSPTPSTSCRPTRSGSTSSTRAPATSPTTTSCWHPRRTRSSSGSTRSSPTRPAARPRPRASTSGTYDIIYKLTDDIDAALKGLLEPEMVEVIEGRAEVRQIFRVGKNTVIAGCYVTDGRIVRGGARVWRGGKVIATDRIESLRRFRDDVREVAEELRVRHRAGQLPRPGGGRRHRVLHPDRRSAGVASGRALRLGLRTARVLDLGAI